MNRKEYYEEMMDKLRQAIEEHNKFGDTNIPHNIACKYNFNQITRFIFDDYIFIYAFYGLFRDDYSECEILLKGENLGYIFNYNTKEAIKLKNSKVIDYNTVDMETYREFGNLIEMALEKRDGNLLDEACSLLEKYFKNKNFYLTF